MIDRMSIFVNDFFTCQVCGRQPGVENLQIAHRIRQGQKGGNNGTVNAVRKLLFKKTGEIFSTKRIMDEIIDNPKNLVTTCSLKCNAAVNIFFRKVDSEKLLEEIISEILEEEI